MVWTAHKAKPYALASGTVIRDSVWRTGLPTDPTIAFGEAHQANGGLPGGFGYYLVRTKSARAASHRPSAVLGTIAQEHRDTVEIDFDPRVHDGDPLEKNLLLLAEGQRK